MTSDPFEDGPMRERLAALRLEIEGPDDASAPDAEGLL
jgi:hypothetical protein